MSLVLGPDTAFTRTRRYGGYAGLLLAPVEGLGLWLRAFFDHFGQFRCPVVTLVTFLKKSKKITKKY